MTSAPKWQSPRRLSQPVAKTSAVTRETEAKRRDVLRRSGLHSARSRGMKRGGQR